jgi:hypothetical protein
MKTEQCPLKSFIAQLFKRQRLRGLRFSARLGKQQESSQSISQAWWHMLVIPPMQEVEVRGGLWSEAGPMQKEQRPYLRNN